MPDLEHRLSRLERSAHSWRLGCVAACAAIAAIVLGGCPSYSNIREAHREDLANVRTGMSLAEFQTAYPRAYPRGENTGTDGVVTTAYESEHHWVPRWGSHKIDYLWFYFQHGKLVKWGDPNDWPQAADHIEEIRVR